MKNNLHRIGAVFYILWGIVHVIGGFMIITTSMSGKPIDTLSIFGQNVGLPGATVNGLAGFHGWNITMMGFAAIAVAAILNWKNSRLGFWLNLSIVMVADMGLLLFLLLPGHMSWQEGSIGISLFAFALVFTTLGKPKNRKLNSIGVYT